MIRYRREEIKLYTPNEFARRLNVSESTILRADRRGILKGGKMGKKLFFHRVDVEDYFLDKKRPMRRRWLKFKKALLEKIEYLEERVEELMVK